MRIPEDWLEKKNRRIIEIIGGGPHPLYTGLDCNKDLIWYAKKQANTCFSSKSSFVNFSLLDLANKALSFLFSIFYYSDSFHI